MKRNKNVEYKKEPYHDMIYFRFILKQWAEFLLAEQIIRLTSKYSENSTMVERLSHQPNVEGLSPGTAAATGSGKMPCLLFVFL